MTWPAKRVPIRPHRQIEDTLQLMGKIVRGTRDHQVVRDMGTKIAAGCAPLDDVCRMRRVRSWVASVMRYERDPRGADLLQSPDLLITRAVNEGNVPGDCDDASLLISALLESVGIPTRFCAISTRPDRKLHHVAVEARNADGTWHWLDAFSARLQVPPATRLLRVSV